MAFDMGVTVLLKQRERERETGREREMQEMLLSLTVWKGFVGLAVVQDCNRWHKCGAACPLLSRIYKLELMSGHAGKFTNS